MSRVGLMLATPPLCYLSSPRALITTTLPCSRKWPNASELLKTGASFAVGPNRTLFFLRPSNFICSAVDAELPDFPNVDTQEPVAFLDAAHANDLRNRRSTAGHAFIMCGGAVALRQSNLCSLYKRVIEPVQFWYI